MSLATNQLRAFRRSASLHPPASATSPSSCHGHASQRLERILPLSPALSTLETAAQGPAKKSSIASLSRRQSFLPDSESLAFSHLFHSSTEAWASAVFRRIPSFKRPADHALPKPDMEGDSMILSWPHTETCSTYDSGVADEVNTSPLASFLPEPPAPSLYRSLALDLYARMPHLQEQLALIESGPDVPFVTLSSPALHAQSAACAEPYPNLTPGPNKSSVASVRTDYPEKRFTMTTASYLDVLQSSQASVGGGDPWKSWR
ncbi:hypothetical protein BV25DRAFT_1915261 [Artomyces pyxidatus]|uniref:Uncharacterized protein n=1 Tax=Artomyces pyxidatus TaxID=48021 RepID=A0ACB8T3T6_9AGAM|nr:hypothetical protein BV25DRAFT_1915261 [Artomyces pyxidatus]